MENNQNQSIQITYSAKEQAEIRKIRSKYLPKEESSLEQLHRLDSSAERKATIRALCISIFGLLTFGLGMSCCLVWSESWFIPGVVIGLAGIAALCLAYPLYNRTLKRERQRIAPEILRLTDELMK